VRGRGFEFHPRLPKPTQRAILPASANEYERKLRHTTRCNSRGLAASAGVRMRAKGEMEISVALWAIEAREETLLFTLLLYRSIACECDMSKHATAEPDAAKYNVSLIYVR